MPICSRVEVLSLNRDPLLSVFFRDKLFGPPELERQAGVQNFVQAHHTATYLRCPSCVSSEACSIQIKSFGADGWWV